MVQTDLERTFGIFRDEKVLPSGVNECLLRNICFRNTVHYRICNVYKVSSLLLGVLYLLKQNVGKYEKIGEGLPCTMSMLALLICIRQGRNF